MFCWGGQSSGCLSAEAAGAGSQRGRLQRRFPPSLKIFFPTLVPMSAPSRPPRAVSGRRVPQPCGSRAGPRPPAALQTFGVDGVPLAPRSSDVAQPASRAPPLAGKPRLLIGESKGSPWPMREAREPPPRLAWNAAAQSRVLDLENLPEGGGRGGQTVVLSVSAGAETVSGDSNQSRGHPR